MRANQVNTSLPSLAKWKEKESNLFQLIVSGSFDKVKRFWRFLKYFSGYRLPSNYQKLFDHLDYQEQELHIVMQLEETPFFLSYLHRKESVVHIQTIDGKNIELPLLDVQLVEMLNGMIYIEGKSYDIFADPIHDQRNEIEIVPCTEDVTEEYQRWN